MVVGDAFAPRRTEHSNELAFHSFALCILSAVDTARSPSRSAFVPMRKMGTCACTTHVEFCGQTNASGVCRPRAPAVPQTA